MSATLLRRTLAAGRWRLVAVSAGLATWGFLLCVVYATFGADIRQIVEGGYLGDLLDALTAIGGGSVFTLGGSVALSFIHPVSIALVAVLVIGHPIAALSGERQRGTLEVLLARPISRRRVYATALVATVVIVVVALAASLGGVIAGATLFDVSDELRLDRLVVAWANAVLLFATLGAIALAISGSFDRVAPALGLTLAFLMVSYVVELLGALWPEMAGWRPWSLFHYFQPAAIMAGDFEPADLAVLAAVAATSVAWGLWIFPRRDLAAPS
jgi:ABC-2 type transport system permease protein